MADTRRRGLVGQIPLVWASGAVGAHLAKARLEGCKKTLALLSAFPRSAQHVHWSPPKALFFPPRINRRLTVLREPGIWICRADPDAVGKQPYECGPFPAALPRLRPLLGSSVRSPAASSKGGAPAEICGSKHCSITPAAAGGRKKSRPTPSDLSPHLGIATCGRNFLVAHGLSHGAQPLAPDGAYPLASPSCASSRDRPGAGQSFRMPDPMIW